MRTWWMPILPAARWTISSGFSLSPVLWRKLPGSRSAGRVQSVALRLICDRELEIEAFRAQEYWSIDATFTTPQGGEFQASLNAIDGKKLGKLDIADEASARAIEQAVKGQPFKVDSLESKPAKRHPYPPFRTSTLQQEASRKLGFSSSRTMQLAQRLYEGIDIGGETVGLITYMRTDGVDMAPEAIAATRNAILKTFGEPYLPSVPRHYTSKAKNAQEAHEAIRPTEVSRHPSLAAQGARRRSARALRPDLEAHRRQPDGECRTRAHHRRHRHRRAATASTTASAPMARW